MKRPQTKPALLFRLVVPVTVVFILTILALIACLFGDPNAPVANWLNENGNQLLIVEFVAVVVLSVLAMVVDRVRTLRGIEEEPFDPTAAAASPATATTAAATSANETTTDDAQTAAASRAMMDPQPADAADATDPPSSSKSAAADSDA